jgi:hypothetical protein
VEQLTGQRPAGLGLSLFRLGTFVWGTYNHFTELAKKARAHGLRRALIDDHAYRNAGFFGMYVAGSLIEIGNLFAQAAARLLGLDPKDPKLLEQALKAPGWRGAIAEAAKAPTPAKFAELRWWGKTVVTHARVFALWNFAGAALYAREGEYLKALALTTAATGTAASGFSEFAALFRIAPLPAALLTFTGGAVMAGLSLRDNAKILARLERLNEDHLRTAGLRPEIAHALAKVNGDGVSVASQLLALARHRHVEPAELLDWLNRQPAEAVERFARDALLPLKANRDGTYVESTGMNDWFPTRYGRGAGQYGDYYGEFFATLAPDPRVISPDDPKFFTNADAQALSLRGAAALAKRFFVEPLPGK